MTHLGQTSSEQQLVTSVLSPYLQPLGAEIAKASDPLIQKMVEASKPAAKELLKEYAPMGIAIAAGLFGLGIFTAIAIQKSLMEK